MNVALVNKTKPSYSEPSRIRLTPTICLVFVAVLINNLYISLTAFRHKTEMHPIKNLNAAITKLLSQTKTIKYRNLLHLSINSLE